MCVTLMCNTLNDRIQNKGAGEVKVAEIWNFYQLSLIPDSNLDGLHCYQSSLLWALVGVRHHSLRLHSQAEACALHCQLKVTFKGQRIYSQFVLLRIFDAPTQDHYLDTFFCCYSLYLLYRKGNFTRCCS